MKTNFLVILFLSIASFSFGYDMPTVSNEKAKTIVINTQNWKGGTLDIKIIDQALNLIYSESINETKSNRSYDVRNLPNGYYTIEMSNGMKTTKQIFEVNSSYVFLDKNIAETFLPVIKSSERYVDVNLLNTQGTTFISIYDASNNLLNTEKIETSKVHRRYNISNLPTKNSYVVEVKSNGNTTYYNFTK